MCTKSAFNETKGNYTQHRCQVINDFVFNGNGMRSREMLFFQNDAVMTYGGPTSFIKQSIYEKS